MYKGTVYLIHFEEKIHHAGHYLGWTKEEDISKRLEYHKKGNGSRLLNAANKKKIPYEVVRVWKNQDGNFERKLKNLKNGPKLCPICNEKLKGELHENK